MIQSFSLAISSNACFQISRVSSIDPKRTLRHWPLLGQSSRWHAQLKKASSGYIPAIYISCGVVPAIGVCLHRPRTLMWAELRSLAVRQILERSSHSNDRNSERSTDLYDNGSDPGVGTSRMAANFT